MPDKKPNILFLSSWYPHKAKPLNGIFIKNHAVANTIDCNVTVIYICSSDNESIEESVEDGVYTLRGYYNAPRIKIAQLVSYLLMWRKILLYYKRKKGKPDLINANIVYPVSIIATYLKFVWKVPYVITEHWTGYFPEPGRYKGFVKKIISHIAVVNAGAVITPSVVLSKTMRSLGLNNRYFIIPNVVNPEQFSLKPLKENGNRQAAVNGGEHFSFIHISSLNDMQKNVSGIIRVFKKFHAVHPFSKLTIVWDEEQEDYVDKLKMKESFSAEDGIFLLGRKMGAELASLIQQADAFVLFRYFETQSIVLLEAMCCGIPVISSRCGGPEEFITEKNGLLVDKGNEDELFMAMENMFQNAGSYSPAEIRNTVVDKVNPTVISKQFADIYKKVMNKEWPASNALTLMVTNQYPFKADDTLSPPKRNIVFLSSWYPKKSDPLSGIFVKRQAVAVAKQCNVSVIYISSGENAELAESVEEGVYTIRAYFKKVHNSIPLISQLQKLLRYITAWKKAIVLYEKMKGKPELIHSNIVFPVSVVAKKLKQKWSVPYIISEHWSGYFPQDGRYQGFVMQRLTKMAVRHASAIITVSAALKESMVNAGLSGNYFVIPNTIDTDIFNIPVTLVKKKDQFQFIHVSSLDETEKNVSAIIRSFSVFHKNYPEAKLMIVGDGDNKQALENLVKTLDLTDVVIFKGYKVREEVAVLMQQADAFVLFSNFETQGVVLLEALCCGIPVIATASGGPKEYIKQTNGILVEPGNEKELIEAMKRMIENRQQYNPIAIRESVVGMVNEKQVAQKIVDVYNTVIKSE